MLIKTIQNFVHTHELWKPNSKIIIAVSGGADSSCLLHVLSMLAKKYPLSLHIAHVNYGLRGADSQKDELFVRELAKKYDLPLTVFSFKRSKKGKISEAELRNFRYNSLEKLRLELNFDLIAVAHNQDDQAETVLLRLTRGTGLAGLAAMKPKNGKIIRPLIVLSRSQILDFLKQKKLRHRTDKTNAQAIYARNKLRLELLPILEKKYNPRIKESLSLMAELIGQDYEFLLLAAASKLKFTKEKTGLSFETNWLLGLHPSLQRNCLRLLIEKVRHDLNGIEMKNIEEILKLAKSSKNKQQKISFGGLKITRKGAKVYMINK